MTPESGLRAATTVVRSAPTADTAPTAATDPVTPSAPSAPCGPVFTTELCRDPDRFAALAPAWHALYRRSRTATPFQSHSWLHSWWLSYGTAGRLRIVLVHRDGELVAAAPLMLVRRPFPVLVPLGAGISDFFDVLIDDRPTEGGAEADAGTETATGTGAEDRADDVTTVLVKALADTARTAVIDLREVRPGAAAERLYARWQGPRRQLADSVCLELPALPLDDLLRRLSSSRAQRARAKARKLDSHDLVERVVPQTEIPAAVERLLELHRLQWQGRKVTAEHLSARFSEHLARSVTSMVEHGDARMTEYRLAGTVRAMDLTLMSGQLEGGYLYGADPALRAKKVDVALMLLRSGARHISTSGRSTLSMLRGTEPYKYHWRPETVRNQRLLLARPPLALFLRLLVAGAAGRGRAAALVKRLRLKRPRLGRLWRCDGKG